MIIDKPRELIDITATAAYMLDIEMPNGKGEVMHELFK